MIKKIIHISDIHIRHTRRDEYQTVLARTVEIIAAYPDLSHIITVITGDIFDRKEKTSAIEIFDFKSFLSALALLTPTVIIPGNHDIPARNYDYFDPIQLVVDDLQSRITYYKTSGHYSYDNILFSVLSRADGTTPDELLATLSTDLKSRHRYNIALIHELVSQSRLFASAAVLQNARVGAEFINNFDLVLAGDNHMRQTFGARQHGAYPGSLFQQNIAEELEKGFYIWHLEQYQSGEEGREFIRVPNDYGFLKFTIEENKFGPMPAPLPRVIRRIAVEHKDSTNINQQSVIDFLNTYYNNDEINPHKTKINNIKLIDKKKYFQFQNVDDDDDDTGSSFSLNILEDEAISEYLARRNYNEEQIYRVLTIHHELLQEANYNNIHRVRWSLISLEWDNILCYGPGNKINFNSIQLHGIMGIIAENQAGKSAVIDVLLTLLYGYTRGSKLGDMIKRGCTSASISGEIISDGTQYKLLMNIFPKQVEYSIDYLSPRGYINKFKGYFNAASKELERLVGNIEDLVGTSIIKQDVRQINQHDFIFKPAKNRIEMIQKYFKINELTELGKANETKMIEEIKETARILGVPNPTGRVSKSLRDNITTTFNNSKNKILLNEEKIKSLAVSRELGTAAIEQCKVRIQEIEDYIIAAQQPIINLTLQQKWATATERRAEIRSLGFLPPTGFTSAEIKEKLLILRGAVATSSVANLTITSMKKELISIEAELASLPPSTEDAFNGAAPPMPVQPKNYTSDIDIITPLSVEERETMQKDIIRLRTVVPENKAIAALASDKEDDASPTPDELISSLCENKNKKDLLMADFIGASSIDDEPLRAQVSAINTKLDSLHIRRAPIINELVINKRAPLQLPSDKSTPLFYKLGKTYSLNSDDINLFAESITLMPPEEHPATRTLMARLPAHPGIINQSVYGFTYSNSCSHCINNRATEESHLNHNHEEESRIRQQINDIYGEYNHNFADARAALIHIAADYLTARRDNAASRDAEAAILDSEIKIHAARKVELEAEISSMRTRQIQARNHYKESMQSYEKNISLIEKKINYLSSALECRLMQSDSLIYKKQLDDYNHHRAAQERAQRRAAILAHREELKLEILLYEARLYEDFIEMSDYDKQVSALSEHNDMIAARRAELTNIRAMLNDNSAKLNTIIVDIHTCENETTTLRTVIEKAAALIDNIAIRDIYARCANQNEGIPAEVLTRCIPIIIKQMNVILSSAGADFYITHEIPTNAADRATNLHLLLCNAEGSNPVETGSGYQNALVSFAMRVALIKYFPGIIADFLILDEALTNFDPQNLSNMMNLIKVIRRDFKFIFIISHLPELQDIIEMPIEIIHTSRGSHIEY